MAADLAPDEFIQLARPAADAVHNETPTTSHEPHQLALQLFGRIDAYAAKPPERALWRELLNLAIGTVRTFRAHNRPFSAATGLASAPPTPFYLSHSPEDLVGNLISRTPPPVGASAEPPRTRSGSRDCTRR